MTRKARLYLKGIIPILCGFFLVLGAAAWYSASVLRDDRVQKQVEELRQYHKDVLTSKSEMISSQLVSWILRGRELAKARIFRASITNFASMKQEKRERAQEDFQNFVGAAGFHAGHLFGINGKLLATTMGKLDETEGSYYESIRRVVETRTPFFSSLHPFKGEMAADLYIPVYPASALSDSAAPDHVLVLVIPLRSMLRSFLASEHELRPGSAVHLIQMRTDPMEGDIFEEVVLAYPDTMKLERIKATLKGAREVEFGKRMDLQKNNAVYSSAMSIPAINWWLSMETQQSRLAANIRDYEIASLVVLVLGGMAAILFTGAAMLFTSARRLGRENEEFDAELQPLRTEHRELKRITEALPTPLCLRGEEDKRITYANEAFAQLCGKPRNVVRGLAVEELFNPAEAQALEHGDQMLAMSDNAYAQEIEIYRGAVPRYYMVWATRLAHDEEHGALLLMFRETTEERQSTRENIEMRQQIIDALVRAVESVPFLDGHTSLLRRLSLEIAETLLLGDADCSTVEAAAILSQVGKTFVPKEIMQKEGKLTPEEIKETQRYVEHTCRLLEGIEFHLPIIQTIWQIQESLDGSGYPNGLQGDEIVMPARILGVANTFSALVQKRSYRKAKTASQAVDILRQMAEKRYDPTVVQALEAVIHSARGRRILEASHIDLE